MSDARLVPPADQQRITAPGSSISFVLDSGDTGGRCSMQRIDCDAHYPGPPPHIHHSMEEMFHVLDGEVSVLLGDDSFTAGPGTTVVIPRNTVHRYWNASDRPHSFLCVCTPAGFEQYFLDMAEYVRLHGTAPDIEARRALYARYDTSLLE